MERNTRKALADFIRVSALRRNALSEHLLRGKAISPRYVDTNSIQIGLKLVDEERARVLVAGASIQGDMLMTKSRGKG